MGETSHILTVATHEFYEILIPPKKPKRYPNFMFHELSVTASDCPALKAMSLLERKWILQILHSLGSGRVRFNALQDSIGDLNSVTLSRRLKLLEQYGIVTREVVQNVPPWVEYELTSKGEELMAVISAVEVWCEKWDRSEGRVPLETAV